jgi:hypothetical protein
MPKLINCCLTSEAAPLQPGHLDTHASQNNPDNQVVNGNKDFLKYKTKVVETRTLRLCRPDRLAKFVEKFTRSS